MSGETLWQLEVPQRKGILMEKIKQAMLDDQRICCKSLDSSQPIKLGQVFAEHADVLRQVDQDPKVPKPLATDPRI